MTIKSNNRLELEFERGKPIVDEYYYISDIKDILICNEFVNSFGINRFGVYAKKIIVQLSIKRPHSKGWKEIDISDRMDILFNKKPFINQASILPIPMLKFLRKNSINEDIFYVRILPKIDF